ncbi:hypothetical protein KR018_000787 [Drosophila ironensis]|nr:hypothetical protein KR018_000787 [Drosophila ironensis]
MTRRSSVLAIGEEMTSEIVDKPDRRQLLECEFQKRMQKILLAGAKPSISGPEDASITRFVANEVKKNGQYYYEFGPEPKVNGWIISVCSFDHKGLLSRVKDKIGKEHWITDNVARFSKDSRDFVTKTVSRVLDEETMEIYQYLNYLKKQS